jgi:hypothetical protein
VVSCAILRTLPSGRLRGTCVRRPALERVVPLSDQGFLFNAIDTRMTWSRSSLYLRPSAVRLGSLYWTFSPDKLFRLTDRPCYPHSTREMGSHADIISLCALRCLAIRRTHTLGWPMLIPTLPPIVAVYPKVPKLSSFCRQTFSGLIARRGREGVQHIHDHSSLGREMFAQRTWYQETPVKHRFRTISDSIHERKNRPWWSTLS